MGFRKFRAFIFDLDGTIWCWQKLYPGVRDALRSIRKSGSNIIFVSNNTLLDRRSLARKLNKFGIEARVEDVINSGYAAAVYLKKFAGNKGVWAFGNGLIKDLKENGIKLSKSDNPEVIVIGHDLTFNMKNLSGVFDALNNGAKLLGTARGKVFVTETKMIVGTGTIVELVENFTGRKAEIIGKPSDFMCGLVKGLVKSKMNETLFVGDEPYDIEAGKKMGCRTCLVKTGVDKKAAGVRPDYFIDSVADIRM